MSREALDLIYAEFVRTLREAWLAGSSFGASAHQTYSEVDARKKGEVSRNASTVLAPRASSPSLLRCMVLVRGDGDGE